MSEHDIGEHHAAARVRENLEALPVELIDGLRARYAVTDRCVDCHDGRTAHPEAGMVRFEWAETARLDGWWYYRHENHHGEVLPGPSMLRRDHAFVEGPDAPAVA